MQNPNFSKSKALGQNIYVQKKLESVNKELEQEVQQVEKGTLSLNLPAQAVQAQGQQQLTLNGGIMQQGVESNGFVTRQGNGAWALNGTTNDQANKARSEVDGRVNVALTDNVIYNNRAAAQKSAVGGKGGKDRLYSSADVAKSKDAGKTGYADGMDDAKVSQLSAARANTYNGTINITQGVSRSSGNLAQGATSAIDGTLTLNGTGGMMNSSNATSGVVTLGGSGQTLNPPAPPVSNQIASGTLSGVNTYSGRTTVTAGGTFAPSPATPNQYANSSRGTHDTTLENRPGSAVPADALSIESRTGSFNFGGGFSGAQDASRATPRIDYGVPLPQGAPTAGRVFTSGGTTGTTPEFTTGAAGTTFAGSVSNLPNGGAAEVRQAAPAATPIPDRRITLAVDFPTEGEPMYFKKLKSAAELTIEMEPQKDFPRWRNALFIVIAAAFLMWFRRYLAHRASKPRASKPSFWSNTDWADDLE